MTLTLTSVGINALLRAMCGDDLLFTNVRIGDGDAQNPATATALANPQKTLTITAMTVESNYAVISTSFNNSTVNTGFRMKEVGIYVQDQDDSSKEVLYAYGSEPDETADYIAASESNIISTSFAFSIFVSSAENIAAIINETLQYATKAAFDDHVGNTSNPHSVSKAQVGLGNVPNVSTNNQTPTYLTPVSASELTSGEKLSVAFGKIARAVSSLIAHIANRNNPHQVTPSQIGASSTSHKHSASDVTSGTLSTARGGTGKSSFAKDKLFYASATDVLSQLPFPTGAGMVLHQGTSGAPFWAYPSGTECGSYRGSNFSGINYPNAITFEKVPNLVFIMQEGNSKRWGLLFPAAGRGFSNYDEITMDLIVSLSNKTIFWYLNSREDHPANQLNSLHTYHYVAIY